MTTKALKKLTRKLCTGILYSKKTWPIGVIYERRIDPEKSAERSRTEKKLSQSALAQLVGVSRNTISSIETGQFNPTAKLALILCIALDKKFEELFYF